MTVDYAAEIGAAWEAIPDDIADNTLTDSFGTLADAIGELVSQRDKALTDVARLMTERDAAREQADAGSALWELRSYIRRFAPDEVTVDRIDGWLDHAIDAGGAE